TDDDLRVQVFQPVAHAVYGQLKTLRTETDSAPQKAPVSPLTSHYLATTPPDLSAATSPLLPNHPVILANAAASVADTIIERYRVALRHADANLPTLVTFRSPGENGEGNLARISMDVRNYCLKLDALNGEAVSPDSHGQRQP
ncbi:MAG: hypothetical protein K2Q12_09535, partial [Rickettsiales bacterium]|nr:hypothetical protein [Rickettsiales bacterium]